MTPEEQWLLALADPERTSGPWPAARTPQGIEQIVALANLHSVLPPVLKNIEILLGKEPAAILADPQKAPEISPLLAPFKNRLAQRTAMTLFLTIEAQRMLGEFAKANVEGIILKGSDFAKRLYANPGLRTFGDMDLLIHPKDWDAVTAIMARLGYESHETPMKHADGYAERSWQNPAMPGATVEVHDNLVNSPTVRKGVSVRLADLPAGRDAHGRVVASPAALMVIATVHAAAGHSFEKLQHLTDILQLARGRAGKIDEDELIDCAAKTGAGFSIALSLELAARAFDEPACTTLLDRLKLRWPRWRARLLMTPEVVVRSQGPKRRGTSWRRQTLRQMMKTRR